VEKSTQVDGGTDIIAYDAQTVKRKVLISASALINPGKKVR